MSNMNNRRMVFDGERRKRILWVRNIGFYPKYSYSKTAAAASYAQILWPHSPSLLRRVNEFDFELLFDIISSKHLQHTLEESINGNIREIFNAAHLVDEVEI